MASFALGWLAFVAWAIATFTTLERLVPRHRAIDRVVATPAFHHRHHCEDLPPANFASTLPLLDQLFGTFVPSTPDDRSTSAPAGVLEPP